MGRKDSGWEEHCLRPFVNGAVASVVAEIVTFPLDLAKTRLQIQGQVLDAKYTQLKYGGPFHAIRLIVVKEGFFSLYSGVAPAVLRQCIYGGLKRGIYESLQGVTSNMQSFLLNFSLACTSGAVSAILCNPVDIVKVRMQSQSTSLYLATTQLFLHDRMKDWFRGVTPNVYRTGIIVGTTFSVYDHTKQVVIHDYGIPDGLLSYTIASSVASFLGTLAANPFDVVKSRMMNQARTSIRYNGVLHCVIETWKNERFPAFYKGCLALLCRTVPWHFVFFFLCEYL